MKALKFCFSVFFFLCSLFLFCFSASAAENSDDAFIYDELNIIADNAVLTGQTQQMRVEEYSGTGTTFLVWTSSNPAVISCTADGKITGIKEGQATITVKAILGDGKDSITVYCAKRLSSPKTAEINQPLAYAFQGFDEFHFPDIHLYFYAVKYNPIAKMIIPLFPFNVNIKINVKGLYDSYFYVEYEKNDKICERFMLQRCFDDSVASNEVFKQLSRTDLDAYVGINMDYYKVTTNYKGEVKWKVSNPDIISFDSTTGKVYCKKPGIATISATADGKTLTCTVHSIYVWPQNWTGAANRETCVYKAVGNTYKETSYTLSAGEKFTVKGDMGDSSGWAYGVDENGGWGYIPISHISTKGTISQYSNMITTLNEKKVPVAWPMYDTSIKNISSPYGPRNITASGSIHHRGYDITTGTPGEIKGKYVVATFSGTVTKIYTNTSDCGHCISISTDVIDPVTNKNISIIYMHLLESPRYIDGTKILQGDYISVGTVIGKVGNSNGGTDPNMGYHLHFEANSQNAAVGDSGRSDFTYTLNPMYFFINKNVSFSSTNSYKKYGGYWYDLDGGYQNEEIFKSYFVF